MKDSKLTLPLEYEAHDDGLTFNGYAVYDADGDWICQGKEPTAQTIVRAVNNHEALVKALEWLVNLGYGVGKAGGAPEDGEFEGAIEAGKAALAKAKEA